MSRLSLSQSLTRVRPHLTSLVLGLAAVAMMLVWSVQDGGYDPSTWYWGALLAVAALPAAMLAQHRRPEPLSRPIRFALVFFTFYVAWSYLSISWAGSPGDALQGSNRALLYLLLFADLALVPWTIQTALSVLLIYALGVGTIAGFFLARLADADNLGAIFVNGRLQAPAGYFNATVALFMMGALLSVGLASRRTLPAPLRGLLLGMAAAGLQLAVSGESRGWLFTLPFVALAAVLLVRDRIRFIIAAALPVVATVLVVHRILHIYDAQGAHALARAAGSAGSASLIACAVTVVAGTLLAAADTLLRPPAWLLRGRRVLAVMVIVLAVGGGAAGAVAATHGHPVAFVKRQWNGFSKEQQPSTSSSRFDVVGSGRYDFWRVALKAFLAHPIGGLGQDNFADYYVKHRRTIEEPAWTHSLEMRLLAHTGIVGFLLFAGFLCAAVVAALRRGSSLGAKGRWVAGCALLPLTVWVIHGSIDWFWEVPALSGPALGFLAIGAAIRAPGAGPEAAALDAPTRRTLRRWRAPVLLAAGTAAWLAMSVVLAFPYLSVVEQSRAAEERAGNPVGALADLATASKLNPLTSAPGRLAGDIALETGQYEVALSRFRQSIEREPGGWFGWFGAGLAASELGEESQARHDLTVARSINDRQPAVTAALARVGTSHALTAAEALKMLVIVQ
jgi:hypothetical protein